MSDGDPLWNRLFKVRSQTHSLELTILELTVSIAAKTANFEGGTQIRTGDKGFAILCLTTWPCRRKLCYL